MYFLFTQKRDISNGDPLWPLIWLVLHARDPGFSLMAVKANTQDMYFKFVFVSACNVYQLFMINKMLLRMICLLFFNKLL